MNVEIKDIGPAKKEMEIVIPKETVKAVADDIYGEIAKAAVIKGFRKGKAPRNVMRMHYGDYITSEMTKRVINDNFEQAVKDNAVDIVSSPDIDKTAVTEGEDCCFIATFDVKPRPEVGDCTGFELKKTIVDVDENAVDDAIAKLRETHAELEDVDDPEYMAQKGDYVVANISSEDNPSLDRQNMTIEAGQRSFIPSLEDVVAGMKLNEENEVQVDFPRDHFMEDMRGKTASVKMEIVSMKTRSLPELDDEFAKKVRDSAGTMDDLRSQIADDLKERIEADSRAGLEKQIADRLIEGNPFDLPASMVDMHAMMSIQGMAQRFQSQGIPMEQLFPDDEALSAFQKETKESSERFLRVSLLVDSLAKKQDIEVSDQDVDEELEKMADSYNVPLDTVKKEIEGSDRMDDIRYSVLERRVYDYIIENAKITDVTEIEDATDIEDATGTEEDMDDPDTNGSGADE